MRFTKTAALKRRTILRLEELESRLAPATLLNSSTVTYTDLDGDAASVHLSKGLLNTGDVGNVFTFNNSFASSGPQQLQLLDLIALVGPPANGLSVTITAVPAAAGSDGLVNVGFIEAAGLNLGTVTVHGDLGRIDAGGLVALTVHSLGQFGTSTQGSPSSLESDIFGKLGTLRVATDINGAFVNVEGGTAGSIGSVSVGGSLIGGASTSSGSIQCTGTMGQVTIGGDIQGGGGFESGEVFAASSQAGVKVGGSLIGGSAGNSGTIQCGGTLGPVTIAGNVQGGTVGPSGGVFATTSLAAVTIGGSLLGGTDSQTGIIDCENGSLGEVTIARDVQGGTGIDSGEITASTTLAGVKVGGALIGAAGTDSGAIFAQGDLGPVTIGAGVLGSSGDASGFIGADFAVGNITITGSLVGGSTTSSGVLSCKNGNMGFVKITGDVRGGSGGDSGFIDVNGSLAGVSIGGSLIGASLSQSGLVHGTGAIEAGGAIGAVVLGHDLIGGSISGSATALTQSGFIEGSRIASLTIGGSVLAGTKSGSGTLFQDGAIQAANDIGPITIGGSLIGNSTNLVIISAVGQAKLPKGTTTDVAIASLTVRGRVVFTNILAGYDPNATAVNGEASIGAVTVGQDWIASNLVAGVAADNHGLFGTPGDTEIGGAETTEDLLARIARILIKGQVLGTPSTSGDHFGFVAEEINAFSVGGVAYKLKAGPSNDSVSVGDTQDVTLLEVP